MKFIFTIAVESMVISILINSHVPDFISKSIQRIAFLLVGEIVDDSVFIDQINFAKIFLFSKVNFVFTHQVP